MYPRTRYEMTDDDLKTILAASKPTPVMFLSGGTPMGGSQQENANAAWSALGKKMGFDYMTVRPVPGENQRVFTAVPSETETQRDERLKREAEEHRQSEITKLQTEIAEREQRILELSKPDNTQVIGD
jgi:hypothetical protein